LLGAAVSSAVLFLGRIIIITHSREEYFVIL
jgi:hypothetical protein